MPRLFLALIATLLLPAAARAGLEVCNETNARQLVSIGYKKGEDWVSEGWWGIDPGACKEPISGDLSNRYYYYRSHVKGKPYASGDINFCTQTKAYTIVGDEDCEARGYTTHGFRKLDTGKTAKHFKLTLVGQVEEEKSAAAKPAAPKPAPKPAAKPAPKPKPANGPGTYGEPYAAAAILQGCENFGQNFGQRQCSFHDGGTKFFVYDDGRTPQFVFTVMAGLDPGTPIAVEGDLAGIYDSTAEVVLRDITVRPWDDAVVAIDRLQGQWYSLDDPNSQFTVLGAERVNSYDGAITSKDYLWVGPWCDRFEGDGPYLMARTEGGDPEDMSCYQIVSLADRSMELMFLPMGNFLSYRKLD